MKIAVASLQQETNTLSPIPTTYEDFVCAFGEDMLGKINVADIFKDAGAQIIPTLYCNALPGGMVVKKDFLRFEQGITDIIRKESIGGIDGVWLYLHGAMFVQGIGSGEKHLLESIRKITGYGIPIAVALDFHANNTDEIVNLANIICGYRTAPHRDMVQTERKAAKLLVECIRRNILPKPKIARANVIMPGDMVQTDNEPLKSIFRQADIVDTAPGFLCAEVFNGQPWVDSEYTGPSVIVVHENDGELALKEAVRLARIFYDKRHEFKFEIEAIDAAGALEIAERSSLRQVYISDSGDNTTAGAAGDNAYMLNRAIAGNLKKSVLIGGIADHGAVAKCFSADTGDIVELTLGASLDIKSEQAGITGKLIHKGNILGWYGEDAGLAAVINTGNITIIITEKRTALIRPGIFESVGVNLDDYGIVIVKLGYLYPDLAKIAPKAILALTPGASTERLEDMGHINIRRPMYPLDDNFM
jgi:microcystin degradation protein MlrC